jgi:hypothetical protein
VNPSDCTSGTCNSGICGGVGFTLNASYPTAIGPWGLASADLDGDGRNDLVVGNVGDFGTIGTTIQVLINAGGGTFKAPVAYNFGSQPSFVAIADFDGDGHPDIVAANNNDITVTVLHNLGNGTFGNFTSFAVGMAPQRPVAADFNGDGKPDIAVTNFGDSSLPSMQMTASVLTNTGMSFGTASDWGVDGNPLGIDARDINGDSKIDLVVANKGTNDVTYLAGNGNGTFQPTYTALSKLNGPANLIARDFNGDGNIDLAITEFLGGDVALALGTGTGQFGAPTPLPIAANTNPFDIASADVNNDGKPDILVTDAGSNDFAAFVSLGPGTFQPVLRFACGDGPRGIAVADLDGDGHPDVAISATLANEVQVFLNASH